MTEETLTQAHLDKLCELVDKSLVLSDIDFEISLLRDSSYPRHPYGIEISFAQDKADVKIFVDKEMSKSPNLALDMLEILSLHMEDSAGDCKYVFIDHECKVRAQFRHEIVNNQRSYILVDVTYRLNNMEISATPHELDISNAPPHYENEPGDYWLRFPLTEWSMSETVTDAQVYPDEYVSPDMLRDFLDARLDLSHHAKQLRESKLMRAISAHFINDILRGRGGY